MKRKELEKIWFQVPPNYYERGIARNLFQKLWHTRKWMVIKKMMDGNPGKVLDIGCASGWMTAKIARTLAKTEVTGLDVSEKMIKYAKTKHRKIIFICADAHQLPFRNKSFDLIICSETLEHVIDPLAVLLEIKRCLSPGGQVIISLDSGSGLFNLVWFFWLKTKGKVWQGAHLHSFNRKKLRRLFKKAAFQIEEEQVSHLGMSVAFKLRKA